MGNFSENCLLINLKGYNNKEDRHYRETLFKPEQVWNRPNPGFQDRYMDPDKRQQLDDYINRSAVKKQEQETFEIIKKKEATKKVKNSFE